MEDSLSGQNMNGRIAGTGSSPVLPTKSQRTKLWNRLRKLDSNISLLDKNIPIIKMIGPKKEFIKMTNKRVVLDQKRMDIRNKLKGYKK